MPFVNLTNDQGMTPQSGATSPSTVSSAATAATNPSVSQSLPTLPPTPQPLPAVADPIAPQIREIKGPSFETSGTTALAPQPTDPIPPNKLAEDDFDTKLAEINAQLADVIPGDASGQLLKEESKPAVPSATAALPAEKEMPLVEDKPLSVKEDKEIPKPGGVLDLQAKTPVLTEAPKPQSAVPVTNVAPASNIQDDFDIVIGTEQKSNTESSSPIAEGKNLVAPLLPAVQPVADSPLAPAVKSEAAGSTPQPAPAAKVQENLANISGVPEVKPVTPNEVKPVRKEEPKPLQISPKPAPRVSLPPLPSDVTVPQYEKEKLNQLEADVKISSESGSKLVTKEYSLDEILRQAVNAGASDVHLNANYRAVARVNGKLLPLQSEVLSSEKIKKMVGQVIGNHRDVDMDSVLDLDLAYVLPNSTARFRVNVYKERDSHAAVFRLIPERIQTIEELGLPPLLREFLTLEQGLVLVTGATGSGKSTTIATLVNEINLKQPKHIVTIEDPIEYVYPVGNAVVSQRAVNSDTESWAAALRSVLRQDPDVVVIGEMRDLETISAALRVAETGHLVFGTLHTNSAAQSVDRIIDVFPEYQQNQIRTQLANVLTAVVSQKLVPVAGGRLRVAVEIMLVNSAVRAAIRENRVYQIDNMIQTSAEEGMISMEKSLIEFVHQGLISPEVAQQFANKPSDLLALLR